MRDKIYAYWLDHIRGIGRKTIEQLLFCFPSAESIYFSKESELLKIISEKQLVELKNSKRNWNLYTEYETLIQKGIHFFSIMDPEYPGRLREIPDRPYALYVKGNLPAEDAKTIAMIGARRCSEYGRSMADEYAKEFAKAGIQVISGMARGIDGYSQHAAMQHLGTTYAVLGCGCDVCYPAESRMLYEQIAMTGGILSEYTPGTQPTPNLFPPRNRIISGLSDAILVIEAKEKSGTLITVDMALEQGREIYAVPGRNTDILSLGCNKLIRQGAGIALSPRDVISELFGETAIDYVETGKGEQTNLDLTEEEKLVMAVLDYMPLSLDFIYQELQRKEGKMNAPKVMTTLVCLQLKKRVGQEGNHYYKLK